MHSNIEHGKDDKSRGKVNEVQEIKEAEEKTGSSAFQKTTYRMHASRHCDDNPRPELG